MSSKERRSILARINGWRKPFMEVLRLAPLRKRILVIIGLFISSISELFGLTMIVPLWLALAGVRPGKAGLTDVIRGAFESLGLPFDPIMLVGIITAALTLKAVIAILVMRYVSEIVSEISQGFQFGIVRGLLRARWDFFIRQPLGRLTHATGTEASTAGECFLSVANIIAGVMQVSMFFIILLLVSWPLAVMLAVLSLLMFLSFGSLVQRSRRAARENRAQLRNMAASFTDAMIGIKPLRAMGRTDRFTELFEGDAKAVAASTRQRIVSGEYASELQEPIIGTLLVLGLYFTVSKLDVAPHDLVIMCILLVRTIATLIPLQKTMQKFLQMYDQYKSINHLQDEIERSAESPGGSKEPSFESAIRLDRVSFAYGKKPVLQDIAFEIRRGEITTIAGPSGVGKSTIVDLIAGLYHPLSGRILIDGVDLREIDLKQWRRHIGYVPQEVILFHATILKNVTLWEDGVTPEDVIEALKAADAWKFVEAMPDNLEHLVGERGNRLSGGQKQRISIARAMLHQPKLLILDEATTGLDPATEQQICEVVRRLCDQRGLTVLAVSHQPAWQKVADRLYMMSDGGSLHEALPPAASDTPLALRIR